MYKIIKVEGAVIMGNVIPFEQITSGKYFNGERLRIARTWRGYSAIQLAEMIGVNRQTISMYENGKLDSPEFPTIQKISEANFRKQASGIWDNYTACSTCKNKERYGYVYITEDGTKYHNTLSCKNLRRTIERVLLEEVNSRKICSRCSKKQ